MLLETLSMRFRKARSVNQTSATFVSKIPTTSVPLGDAGTATGASVIELGASGSLTQNAVKVVPFGVGADTNTFSIRIIGWQEIPNPGLLELWVPVNYLEVQCTIDTANPGIAGTPVDNTNFFCDTITVTTGSTLSGEAAAENIVSPANDTIAHFLVDLRGAKKLELSFSTGSSATSCNALLSLL